MRTQLLELAERIRNLGVVPDEIADELDDLATQVLVDAGADVTDALAYVYELVEGDEASVGELLYECDKAARIRWHKAHG